MFVSKVYAACDPGGSERIDLGECLRLSNDQTVGDVYNTPGFLLNLILSNVFVLGGVILFFMIMYAGLQMVMGGKKGFDSAKQVGTQAVIGFLIMFCAYWIVALIQYLTNTDLGLV